MRDFIRLVEGDVVPFSPRPTKEPQWTDHPDGLRTKPLTVRDFLDDDEPPEQPEHIDIYGERVTVQWYDWMRDFSVMDLNRMFKLHPGEHFEAIDTDRRPHEGYPPPRWSVKRDAMQYSLGFTYWHSGIDEHGKPYNDSRFGWKRYGLPVHDLAAAFQRLKIKLQR